MKKLNPEHVSAVLNLINEGPYFKLLSMEVREMRPGYSRVEVDVAEKHLNPFGGLHGGVYASTIDTAAYWAIYCELEEEVGLISLDLNVDNLAAVRDGLLIIEGRRIKVGRSVCSAEVSVKDAGGKYLAHGTSKQMVTRGLQTIGQAVQAMGHPALPPKFIELGDVAARGIAIAG